MANLYNVPLKNAVYKTLANTLTSGETGTITFATSVSSDLQASSSIPGILVIDRVDVNGTLTPALTEYISFEGVSGSTVTGLVRGLGGTSAQGHSIGAIVEFVPDVVWADAINDVITTQHNADGTHKTLSSISLVSTTISNSTLDSFTFKTAISGATQGDLIAFNAGQFSRIGVASLNQYLSITSTASGLLPGYTTIPTTRLYTSRVSTTAVTPNAYTDINNSNISLSLTAVSNVKINYSFGGQNNTANRPFYVKLVRGSTDLREVLYFPGLSGTGMGVVNGFFLDSNVSVGSYNYKFQVKNFTASDQIGYIGYTDSDILIEVTTA